MAVQVVPEVTLGVRLYLARTKGPAAMAAGGPLHQEAIADALKEAGYKTSRGLVSMWERDQGPEPTPSKLRIIAKLTGVPYGWLVGADEASSRDIGGHLASSLAA